MKQKQICPDIDCKKVFYCNNECGYERVIKDCYCKDCYLKNFGHDPISKDLQAKGCPRFKLTFVFR
jgi:hypothetical protein